MANVNSSIVIMLKEKGIERGYRCGQTPGANYFEKKNGEWVDTGLKTVVAVFEKKRWKFPTPVAKPASKKVKVEKKPAKKAVKKNEQKTAKTIKSQEDQSQQVQCSEDVSGE